MNAPAIPQDQLEKAIGSILDARGLKDLNLIAKSDEVSGLRSAVEQYRDHVTTTIDEKIKAADERTKGELAEWKRNHDARLDKIEKSILEADRRGLPDSKRVWLAGGDEVKHAVHSKIGRAGRAAWLIRDGAPPSEIRAQLGLTETKGGVAIPEMVLEDYFYTMLDHGVARQVVPPNRQFPLDDSLTAIFPTITVRPSTIKGTEGVAGAGATDATFATKANSMITAEIVKGWVPFSKAIPVRHLERLESVIGDMLLEDVGHQEDESFFNGQLLTFTGLLQAAGTAVDLPAGVTTVEALKNIDAHPLFGAMKRIAGNHIGRGVFVFNPDTWTVIESLTDGQNRPLYGTGPMGSTPAQFPAPVSVPTELRFLNRPVYLSTAIPGVDTAQPGDPIGVYFDPSAAGIAAREPEVRVDESIEVKEINRVFIAWELFAHKLMLPTCARVLKLAAA